MKDTNLNNRINVYNEIYQLVSEGNSYLQVIKGYCENEMESSEAIAKLFVILDEACNIHEKLYDKIDELIASLNV